MTGLGRIGDLLTGLAPVDDPARPRPRLKRVEAALREILGSRHSVVSRERVVEAIQRRLKAPRIQTEDSVVLINRDSSLGNQIAGIQWPSKPVPRDAMYKLLSSHHRPRRCVIARIARQR